MICLYWQRILCVDSLSKTLQNSDADAIEQAMCGRCRLNMATLGISCVGQTVSGLAICSWPKVSLGMCESEMTWLKMVLALAAFVGGIASLLNTKAEGGEGGGA